MAVGWNMACEAPTTGPADQRQMVALGLTDLLYRNLPLGLLGTVVIAALLAYGMLGQMPAGTIFTWFLASFAVTMARVVLWHMRAGTSPESYASGKWQLWFEVGAAASGVMWGISAISLFSESSLPHQVFLGFVLASMAAGAISTLGMHLRTYALYLLPSLAPYTIQLLHTGGELQLLMATVFILGQVVLLVSARRFNEVTVNALSLRFENDRLV